jgi:urease accessory protein
MPFHRLISRPVAQGAAALVMLATLNSIALAHPGLHAAGVADGLAHPFSGLDHVLAMVAVGLWASCLGRPACWVLPLTFPAVMALGAAMSAGGMAVPGIETTLVGTVVALGAVIALAVRPSLGVSAALIAMFALIHGYSHGADLPQSASALAYGAGFIAATLVLHAAGLALGTLPRAKIMPRATGAAIAAAGLLLLVVQ